MATENILMAMVKAGGNRQECHEKIRVMSHESGKRAKQEGLDNDLIQKIKNDPYFNPIKGDIDSLLDPKQFVGRAPQQVLDFLEAEVEPIRQRYSTSLDKSADVRV